MTPERFKQERKYLKNVTPKTLAWYDHSFKTFEGALGGKVPLTARITELRERGVSPVSINTYLRCINAYFRWLQQEHGAVDSSELILRTVGVFHNRCP